MVCVRLSFARHSVFFFFFQLAFYVRAVPWRDRSLPTFKVVWECAIHQGATNTVETDDGSLCCRFCSLFLCIGRARKKKLKSARSTVFCAICRSLRDIPWKHCLKAASWRIDPAVFLVRQVLSVCSVVCILGFFAQSRSLLRSFCWQVGRYSS